MLGARKCPRTGGVSFTAAQALCLTHVLALSRAPLFCLAVPNTSDNDITIIVEPSTGILRAVWARPMLTAGLIDSYYYLLDEAVKANCRFWHLDLRLRIWPAATFKNWLIEPLRPWLRSGSAVRYTWLIGWSTSSELKPMSYWHKRYGSSWPK
jgi:hypothetical protein